MVLLVNILILLLVAYIIHLILGWLQLPEPFHKIVYIIAAIILLVWLLRLLGIY